MNRVALAEACAERWSQLGLRWAVVHGLEGYPDQLGRDLDILVHRADLDAMAESAIEVLAASGFDVARPPDIWGKRVIGFNGAEAIELHAVTKISWREICLAEEPRSTEMRGPFPVDPWAALAKQVVLPAWAGETERAGKVLAGHRPEALASSTDDRRLKRLILEALGPPGDPDRSIHRLLEVRRVAARMTWSRHPVDSIRRVAGVLWAKVLPFARPSGLTVELDGSDASALAEVIDALDRGRRSIFTSVRVARTGKVSGVLGSLGSALAARAFIRQQTVLFRVGTTHEGRLADLISAISVGPNRTLQPPIYLDFGNGLGPAGGIVLEVGGLSPQAIADKIWQVVESRFTAVFPPEAG